MWSAGYLVVLFKEICMNSFLKKFGVRFFLVFCFDNTESLWLLTYLGCLDRQLESAISTVAGIYDVISASAIGLTPFVSPTLDGSSTTDVSSFI